MTYLMTYSTTMQCWLKHIIIKFSMLAKQWVLFNNLRFIQTLSMLAKQCWLSDLLIKSIQFRPKLENDNFFNVFLAMFSDVFKLKPDNVKFSYSMFSEQCFLMSSSLRLRMTSFYSMFSEQCFLMCSSVSLRINNVYFNVC